MQSPTMQSRGEFLAPALALTTETVLTSRAPPPSDRIVVQIALAGSGAGAGVSVRAARFSSGIWSPRVDRRPLLNRGIAPARAAGSRSASGSLFTGLGATPRP
jgi:hypothetical protein